MQRPHWREEQAGLQQRAGPPGTAEGPGAQAAGWGGHLRAS